MKLKVTLAENSKRKSYVSRILKNEKKTNDFFFSDHKEKVPHNYVVSNFFQYPETLYP